ncbi:MAG: hypothetical protein EZS28_023703 [Streblomastix strix]|uniref:Uncharacterized protein n=1 Tax=Streblomastix strix TaxID=222440 RepID=A0A5J4VE60_9EUKA|nr:MAG: hypothetical protein EZS28_023703 [Streblomastix strix]
MTSPRAIVEVDSPFEKESQPVAQIQTRRRSSIFEETIMPDPSVCRWLLDIISEDEQLLHTRMKFQKVKLKQLLKMKLAAVNFVMMVLKLLLILQFQT